MALQSGAARAGNSCSMISFAELPRFGGRSLRSYVLDPNQRAHSGLGGEGATLLVALPPASLVVSAVLPFVPPPGLLHLPGN